MLQPWFVRYPEILTEEKAALAPLGFILDEARLAKEGVVCFRGASAADPTRKLTLIYPAGYPSFPPRAFDDPGPPLLSRHHHPQTREFCLFGPAGGQYSSSEQWGPSAVAEVETLIADYPPGKVVNTIEVAEPVSALMPTSLVGGFLIPTNIAAIELPVAGSKPLLGRCTLHVHVEPGKPARGLISNADIAGRTYHASAPFSSLRQAKTLESRLVVLGDPPPVCQPAERLAPWLRLAGLDRNQIFGNHWLVYAYPEESGTSAAFSTAWTVLHVDRTTNDCFRAFPLRAAEHFARIPAYSALADKSVVVVGIGSIGSRIATSLAASGVCQLLLWDRDVYEPANSVRHELGVSAFGVWKSDAMLTRLIEANPGCIDRVRAGHSALGSGSPEDERLFADEIDRCDLVVNATGSEHASHWLNRVCLESGKPCVHASVTDGAWGGEVIRVLPNKSACWLCHQLAEPSPAAAGGGRTLYAPGCAQPTFAGSMPEVSVIADIAATICIETLLARPGYDLTGSHLRWNARTPSGALSPAVVVSEPSPRAQCPFCAKTR
jgi:molybdopterin/thiamine biosynthesis adenylyltransferase